VFSASGPQKRSLVLGSFGFVGVDAVLEGGNALGLAAANDGVVVGVDDARCEHAERNKTRTSPFTRARLKPKGALSSLTRSRHEQDHAARRNRSSPPSRTRIVRRARTAGSNPVFRSKVAFGGSSFGSSAAARRCRWLHPAAVLWRKCSPVQPSASAGGVFKTAAFDRSATPPIQ
jgi:hypothetical protein